MKFQNEKEVTEFLTELIKSNFWEWILEVLRGREATVFNELGNMKHSAHDGALLTGRLIELRYLLNFPSNSLLFFKAQEKMADEMIQKEREELIAKTAFPDVITH